MGEGEADWHVMLILDAMDHDSRASPLHIDGPIWEEERLIPEMQSTTGNASCKL